MAATCDVCGKGPQLRQQHLALAPPDLAPLESQLQSVRAMIGRTPKRLNVCTSCLKAGKVTRA